ncbi:MAG: cobalt-precorrin-6A reductase [Paracoccaceae bacterium]
MLLLAGTGEARQIAGALALENIPAMASMAGATRDPKPLAIFTRFGGFGGAEAFTDFIGQQNITAILDATHPFAARISNRTAEIAKTMAVPYMQLLRPPWHAEPGDLWTMIASEQNAADHIPIGSTVFLATGRQTLKRYENMVGRQLICRQIDPPEAPFPYANGEFLIGRPPFSVEDETALFENLGVDWLVVKNAGGQTSRTKLTAARNLSIPVAMVQRPLQPKVDKVETVEQALQWVRGLA